MQIPSYQIHNVLNVYRRQLSQVKLENRKQISGSGKITDRFSISAEGKRRAIIEKVANNIVDRLINQGPNSEFEQTLHEQLSSETAMVYDKDPVNGKEFKFNTLDNNNKKVTRSISIQDSRVLINRLDELAKEAVDKKVDKT